MGKTEREKQVQGERRNKDRRKRVRSETKEIKKIRTKKPKGKKIHITQRFTKIQADNERKKRRIGELKRKNTVMRNYWQIKKPFI